MGVTSWYGVTAIFLRFLSESIMGVVLVVEEYRERKNGMGLIAENKSVEDKMWLVIGHF